MIERAYRDYFRMSNAYTFEIDVFADLIKKHMGQQEWIDPFSGKSTLAACRNDINPEMPAQHHMNAVDFLKMWQPNSWAGGLLDGPYTVRQISEHYKRAGLVVTMETTQSSWFSQVKDQMARIIKPGGKCITFGYETNGLGKCRGFEWVEGVMIHSGGPHINIKATVERKVNGSRPVYRGNESRPYRKEPVTCYTCNITFANSLDYRKHIRTEH